MFRRERYRSEHTGIALIIIRLQRSLCDFDVVLAGEGVEGMFAAGEDFASVAVAASREVG